MKLGELFVDLGVNAGGAFGTLSGFAFKFNQLADFAKNLGGTLDKVFGETPNYAHDINSLVNATEISRKSIQGMSIAAKENGGSLDQMMSKIRKYDDEVFQMKLGKGNLASRLGLLGINTFDVLNAKDGTDIIAAIMKTANRLTSKRDRASFLSSEGFTVKEAEIWNEYLKNRAKYDNDKRILTKEEINNLNTVWKIQQKLANDRKMALDKLRAKNAEKIVEWETKLNNIMQSFDEFVYGESSFSEMVENVAKSLGVTAETAKSFKNSIEEAFIFFDKTKKVADDFTKTRLWDYAKEFAKGFYEGIEGLGELAGESLYGASHETQKSGGGAISSYLKYSPLKDLGLSGTLANISDPRISSMNVGNMRYLDSYLSKRGYEVFYTGAMGGKHAYGSGHYTGNKIDFQIKKNGKFTQLSPEEYEHLRKLGYFSHGGVGWEPHAEQQGGGHYDTFIGGNPFESRTMSSKAPQYITLNNEVNVSTTDAGIVGSVINGQKDGIESLENSLIERLGGGGFNGG